MGPVEPKHEPGLLMPMTKNLSVSSGLPGPIMLSHQPSLLGLGGCFRRRRPATWCDAFRAWHTSTALLRSALRAAVGFINQRVVVQHRAALQGKRVPKCMDAGVTTPREDMTLRIQNKNRPRTWKQGPVSSALFSGIF